MPDEQKAPEGITENALQNLEAYVKRCKILPEWEALRLIAEVRRLQGANNSLRTVCGNALTYIEQKERAAARLGLLQTRDIGAE